MRFQSTFRLSKDIEVRAKRKSASVRPGSKAGDLMEKVLEACIQLPQVEGGSAELHQYLAEAVRKIFATAVSGILIRQGSGYSLAAISSPVKEGADKAALLSHVSTFATQA